MIKCWETYGGELRQGGARISKNLRKYSPSSIEFVNSYEESDFVILHHQYLEDLDWYLNNCKKPMIFLLSELQQNKSYFNDFFSNPLLKMTYTFHPLEILGYTNPNQNTRHIYAPWGFDEEIFNIDDVKAVNSKRDNTIICFSFYDSEHLSEIYDSCRLTGGKMLHTDFRFHQFLRQGRVFDEKYHMFKEWISDEELIKWYLSCKFVSGTRSGSGFELPIIEGAVCGAKPICFDSIYYRKWFNEFALFIPEGEYDIDMTNNVTKIFNNSENTKMTVNEIKEVRNKFGWQTIATNFWKEVLQSL